MQTILVVDDDQQLTKLIEMSLSQHGFRIMVAHDGEQALRMALQDPPDLVIADIVMPHLDGPAFISQLWEKLGHTRIPVIYLTGLITKAEEEFQREVIGSQYFLAKPFEPSVLKALVGEALR